MSPTVRKALMVVLLLASAFFIAGVLHDNIVQLKEQSIESIRPSWLAALAACVVMLLLKAWLHVLLLEDLAGARVQWHEVLASYGLSQLVRYLPGKLWGIAYQGERLAHVVPRQVTWSTNVVQTLVTNLNGVVLLGCVLAFFFSGVSLFLWGIALWWLVIYLVVRGQWVVGALAWLPQRWRELARLPDRRPLSVRRALAETALLQIEWVAYFAMWFWLLPADLSLGSVMTIACAYAGGALIGIAVIVMPSGWLVREASFVWIGRQFGIDEGLLLVFSVVARVIFTLGDLLCAATLGFGARWLISPPATKSTGR